MESKPRLLRVTTVPISLKLLLRGQLRYMQQQGFEILAVSADGREVNTINSEGIRHQVVPMTRKITPVRDFVCLVQLIMLIRKFDPHIVHTHTPKAGLLAMIAAWVCSVPVRLHTVAGLPLMEASGWRKQLLQMTESITYRFATVVYVNSAGLKTFIEAHGISPKKLNMIGKGSSNGIDTAYFKATLELRSLANHLRSQLNVSPGDIVFVFVGRIVRDKGINELLKAFVNVSKEFQCKLILIGSFEDDLNPISGESMEIINTNPDVFCLGYQEDIRPALLASDIFVFPSYREGFPNVVMQACCLELPCIVSDINGSNEIIQNGLTGLVVKPKEVEALSDAMKKLAGDEDLRKQFGGPARQKVVENFDQAYIWRLLLEEYRKQLNNCTPHS